MSLFELSFRYESSFKFALKNKREKLNEHFKVLKRVKKKEMRYADD